MKLSKVVKSIMESAKGNQLVTIISKSAARPDLLLKYKQEAEELRAGSVPTTSLFPKGLDQQDLDSIIQTIESMLSRKGPPAVMKVRQEAKKKNNEEGEQDNKTVHSFGSAHSTQKSGKRTGKSVNRARDFLNRAADTQDNIRKVKSASGAQARKLDSGSDEAIALKQYYKSRNKKR